MLGWAMLVASVVLMYRVAEIENRSGILWGISTFILCILSTWFIPLPFINILIGVAMSYTIMFIIKLLEK